MKSSVCFTSVLFLCTATCISQDTLIAYYERVSLSNYQVTEIYVISIDSIILEVTRPPKTFVPVPMPQMEMRMQYNVRQSEKTFTMVSKENQLITSLGSQPMADSIERYSIEESSIDGLRVVSLYADSTWKNRVILSNDVTSFHPLSLYYPALTTMPVKIENEMTVTTLIAVITDKEEQRKIIEKFQLDVESFRFMTKDDLEREVEKNFGIPYELYEKMIMKMIEERMKPPTGKS